MAKWSFLWSSFEEVSSGNGGYAEATKIPSFVPVGEANFGFASTFHFQCTVIIPACNLAVYDLTTRSVNGDLILKGVDLNQRTNAPANIIVLFS